MGKLFLQEEQIGKLLELSAVNPRDHALFHMALSTGFRVSDLLRIKRRDLQDSDGKISRLIRLKMKKTGKYIERPLRDDCREVIAAYLKSRKDDNPFVFRPEANNSLKRRLPMDRSSVHRVFKKYLRGMFPSSMLKGASCHTTRRSIAKIISRKSGRVEPAARFLGHKSIATTTAYLDMEEFGRQADDIVTSLSW